MLIVVCCGIVVIYFMVFSVLGKRRSCSRSSGILNCFCILFGLVMNDWMMKVYIGFF